MRRLTTRLAAGAALGVMVGSLLLSATPAAAKPLRAECADGGTCAATVR